MKKIVEHQLKTVKRTGESVHDNIKHLKQELEINESKMEEIVKIKHELEEFLNKN